MKVLFAPDWREGVPYQRLLAEALAEQGVEVEFLRTYRRILPLARLIAERRRAGRVDFFHLHWPEAYYPPLRDGRDWFRCARFPLDLALATRQVPLAVTAHNLIAHNRADEPFAFRNARAALRRARVVFAHSPAAKTSLVSTYGLQPERILVVPHGDLSMAMPPPIPRKEARARCGLGEGPVCLLFGAIEPYKGIEEVLAQWRQTRPEVELVITGKPATPEYGAAILRAAEGIPNVTVRAERLTDAELACWLSAVDVVIFNYRAIFTSGAASLARSWGVPILFPARFGTVDLGEPSPYVCRYSDFGKTFTFALARALAIPPSFEAAAAWRESIGWSEIARSTAAAYRNAVRS
jgi:glycosyltransferase involved in cell wall biosynthesis